MGVVRSSLEGGGGVELDSLINEIECWVYLMYAMCMLNASLVMNRRMDMHALECGNIHILSYVACK